MPVLRLFRFKQIQVNTKMAERMVRKKRSTRPNVNGSIGCSQKQTYSSMLHWRSVYIIS